MTGQELTDGSAAHVVGRGIDLQFQCGPVRKVGVNGTTIEAVIDLLGALLEGFNQGSCRCRENSLAITALQEAQNWLYRRTRQREARGIEGTSEP